MVEDGKVVLIQLLEVALKHNVVHDGITHNVPWLRQVFMREATMHVHRFLHREDKFP